MQKKFALVGLVSLAFVSSAAFAQSGTISIPGVAKANGSLGSTVTDSRITVANNTAKNVTAGGGGLSFKIGEVTMAGLANVNSVNITGSTVKNSDITVSGNGADNINAIGGTANVNSVNIN